ncbi:MAG: hypothetical protein EU550_01685 [Promethearchaeota archaeon]|nr:MAG: hypothetical protein EU550_01685 [Candidatus Lokiarchaeota archaeon]
MLSVLGWIDGLTATGVVLFGLIFGSFFLYKSKKSEINILTFLGIATIFAGLMYLGVFLDFLFVLITTQNMTNTHGIVALLSYIWLAPAIIISIYIGTRLLNFEKKWYLLSIFVVLGIIFDFIIFLDPFSAFDFDPPMISGDALIDYNVNTFSAAGILMAIFLLSVTMILGVGFLIKSIRNTGVLRKKLLLISVGAFSFCIFGLIEGLTAPDIYIIIVRIGYLVSFWLLYFGLKE